MRNCVTAARQTLTLFVGVRIPIPQPYREAKKDVMASNPRNLTISGVFLAFPRFFAIMRFADTACRKKISFQKNGSLQDWNPAVPVFKGRKCADFARLLPFFRIFIEFVEGLGFVCMEEGYPLEDVLQDTDQGTGGM